MEIYPMDSAIQRLNNQGQQEKWMDPFFTTLAGTTTNKWKIRLFSTFTVSWLTRNHS